MNTQSIEQLRSPHGVKSLMTLSLLPEVKRAVVRESRRLRKSQTKLINDALAEMLGLDLPGGKSDVRHK